MDIAPIRHRFALVLVLVLGSAVLAGCGEPAGPAPAPPATAEPAMTLASPDAAAGPATVARLHEATDVFDAPRGAVQRSLPAATDFGSQTVLLITRVGAGEDAGWLEVLLPGRPNGALGWIRTDAVEVREVTLEVRVDLAARTLTLREGEEVVWSTPTAIGDPDHPTPTGRFYVTDKLDTGDPDGGYGPYALGLSAYSDVLTEFAGGDGQVGIHGTNVPSSIGQTVSHGCLRIDNGLVAELAALLPLGTPVMIS